MLEIAKEGVYQKTDVEQYERNYQLSGGKYKLSDYNESMYGSVMLKKELSSRISK